MYNRVHPAEKIKPYSTGDAHQKIDLIVEDVETELERIHEMHNKELQEIYGYPNEIESSLKSNNKVRGKGFGNLAEPYDEESKSVDGDVKFSHEVLESDNRIANELNVQFINISAQLNEYKRRYLEISDKLKDVDNKLNVTETKLDESEDENLKLREELRMGGQQHTDGPMKAVVRLNRLGGASQQELEMNKRSEQIRKALLADDGDDLAVNMDNLYKSRNLFAILKGWLIKYKPFKGDLRQTQARFGSSVACYFTFLRFVYLQMCLVALAVFVLAVLHIISLSGRRTALTAYVINPNGYIPRFMSYSSFSTSERLAYSTTIVLVLVATCAALCMKIVEEAKHIKQLEIFEDQDSSPYSKELLCAWDFSLSTRSEVDDLCGSLGNKYLQQLEATHSKGEQKTRSNYDKFVLYSRRLLGMFIYAYVMFVSVGSIVYLTINAEMISRKAAEIRGMSNFASLISPVMLSGINMVVPVLLGGITKLERWDSATTELQFLLGRVFISNTLNSLILALSYLLLTDPFLLAQSSYFRNNLQLQVSTSYTCRFDQAADGLFTLVLFTWVIKIVTLYASPLLMQFGYKYILRKPWVKEEFNVAGSMVNLLNFMGLVFMSFPFAPLTMLFVPPYLFISFKWEKYCMKHFCTKPQRIGTGQKAGLVFTVCYLLTFLVLGAAVGFYFLSSKTLPKSCSIQDVHVGLCDSEVIDGVCDMDSSSIYYEYYSESVYPLTVCQDACGPFVDSSSNVSPFKHSIFGVTILGVVWVIFFDYPYLPWLGVVVLALAIAMKSNSMDVQQLAAFDKVKIMQTHINTIDAERKRQERTIRKLKTIEESASSEGVEESHEE